MATLERLKGTDGRQINCLFIQIGSEIEVILRNSLAATSAGDNGALNVWKDDDGFIRCESMRYCRSIEEKIFKTIQPAIKWVDKWLPQIN